MPAGTPVVLAPGLVLHPGWLDAADRLRLAGEIAAICDAAPPYTPRMPRTGKPFSVRMTNCGSLGWVSDEAGYRYQPDHPLTGRAWPAMPETALQAWRALADPAKAPEACLVNLYDPGARMGLHQDRDEDDLSAPVLSLSLGATALFRYGGLDRRDPTRSVRLASGDVLVMGGASRLVHHGIDRLIEPPTDLFRDAADDEDGRLSAALARVLAPGGRCNLTLRRVTQAGIPGRA